jgi:hypothetical protein
MNGGFYGDFGPQESERLRTIDQQAAAGSSGLKPGDDNRGLLAWTIPE